MSDERKAKLPGLTVVSTGNVALDRWMQAVTERLEVREGSRGSDLERVVTQRDLRSAGFVQSTGQRVGSSFAGVMVTGGDGTVGTLPFSVFESELRKTKLYSSLTKRLDDVTRFDDVPEKVRKLLLNDIASEAAKRGADIQRVEYKLQSAEESLAYTLQEVTAAVANASAGVREVTYASATANTATAGKVTQLVAALDGTGSASLEESLTVIADRTTGLSAQMMLQVNAGGAVAGIGLMASEDPTGATKSAFIVQADDFGLIGTVTYSQAATPTATVIGQTWYNTTSKLYYRASATGTGSWVAFTPAVPFGVDTVTGATYINGSLRVNANGPSITDSVGKYTDYIFQRSATVLTTAPTGNTPLGWDDTPPSGPNPLYMSVADKTAAGVLISPGWSVPVRLDGAPGVGIAGQYTESQYAVNASATVAPVSGFTSTQPALSTGQFMWMQIRTVTPPAAAGAWGTAVRISGEKGGDGTSISSVTNYYLASASATGVTTGTAGWTTAIQNATASLKYLWNYEAIGYTSGSPTNSAPAIIGTFSSDGTPGRGISSIAENYAVSTSNVTAPTVWTATPPVTTTTNKYLWNYEVITYTDATTFTSVKRVIGTHGETGAVSTTPGPIGKRGTIVTKIAGAWDELLAWYAVYLIATAVDSTATNAEVGDIVYYNGGAKECTVRGTNGTWANVASYINGTLVVNGTITANQIIANGITRTAFVQSRPHQQVTSTTFTTVASVTFTVNIGQSVMVWASYGMSGSKVQAGGTFYDGNSWVFTTSASDCVSQVHLTNTLTANQIASPENISLTVMPGVTHAGQVAWVGSDILPGTYTVALKVKKFTAGQENFAVRDIVLTVLETQR